MADRTATDLGYDEIFVNNDARIDCADARELVTEHLEGTLSADDAERFLAHVDLCEDCSVYLIQIKYTVRLLGVVGRRSKDEFMPSNWNELVTELHRTSKRLNIS